MSFVITALLTSITPQIKPLSESSAKYGALAIGTGIGVGTGALTYFGLKNTINNPARIAVAVISAAVAGSISWGAAYYVLNSLTPQSHFASARRLVQLVELDSLISRNFPTPDSFYGYIGTRFGTSWPLVQTRQHLIKLSNHLTQARSLIASCCAEARQTPALHYLCKESEVLLKKIPYLTQSIEEKMGFISQNVDYRRQVEIHERHAEAERERKHQEWLKTQDRWHDSSEKRKDRKFKKEAISQSGRVTSLNVTI